MPPYQLKQYWRNHPNTFPSGLEPLPPNLAATEIIINYPNHLEDRDVVLSLIDEHGLHCGQIYDLMPDSLKEISTKQRDVRLLGSKAHSARGGKSMKQRDKERQEVMGAVEEAYGNQYEYDSDIEVPSSPEVRPDDALLALAQPSWVYFGARCDHPALSAAAVYRSVLSGRGSGRPRMYNRLPDDIRSTIAKASCLGQSIEQFTAMARLVRYYEGKVSKHDVGDEESEEEDGDGGAESQEQEDDDDECNDLRGLMFELTCEEVLQAQGGLAFAKIGGLERFTHQSV